MRADESKLARAGQLTRLKNWMNKQRVNECFPINTWYRIAAQLELGRSDRQRIADARKEGYQFHYDRAAKAYKWLGKEEVFQLTLEEVNAPLSN